jgi:hypothetical protein
MESGRPSGCFFVLKVLPILLGRGLDKKLSGLATTAGKSGNWVQSATTFLHTSDISTNVEHTGADILPDPTFKFNVWYTALAKP